MRSWPRSRNLSKWDREMYQRVPSPSTLACSHGYTISVGGTLTLRR